MKNWIKKSLHRYIVLRTENVVKKDVCQQSLLEVKTEIKLLAETMKQGFEAVDKRFEDMNKKFTMMFTFMNIGFSLLILITILF